MWILPVVMKHPGECVAPYLLADMFDYLDKRYFRSRLFGPDKGLRPYKLDPPRPGLGRGKGFDLTNLSPLGRDKGFDLVLGSDPPGPDKGAST